MSLRNPSNSLSLDAVRKCGLDGYLENYNTRRPHRIRGMEGRTPYEVFKAGIPRKPPTPKPTAGKEVETAA